MYSGGCGPTWLRAAGTEHICDDHMEMPVVDGEGVPLPCKVQSAVHCLLALMGDVVVGGGATLLMRSRKEDAFTDRQDHV